MPLSGFSWVGAVGYGPPGNDLFFPDPLAGDIAFHLDVPHGIAPGDERDPLPAFWRVASGRAGASGSARS